MANNNATNVGNYTRPHRNEDFNNAGACSLGILQLLGSFAIIGLGVAALVIEEELKYYGIPLYSGVLFFLTAVMAFVSARKTVCGITTFLLACMLATMAAAGLLVLFAYVLSQSEYTVCTTRLVTTQQCTEYTTRNDLLIIHACTLGVFALEFTTGSIGIGLCLCGICRRKLGRTSAAPSAPPPSITSHNTPTVNVVSTANNTQMNSLYSHEVATPSAPPEHVVAEEQFPGPFSP